MPKFRSIFLAAILLGVASTALADRYGIDEDHEPMGQFGTFLLGAIVGALISEVRNRK